jgi:hypothetical protein
VWSRTCADDAALHGMCASATLSRHEAKPLKHRHMVVTATMNAYFYVPAHSYMEDRITDACVHRRRAHVLRSCARACGCGFGRPRIRAEPCAPFPVGVDRVLLGL